MKDQTISTLILVLGIFGINFFMGPPKFTSSEVIIIYILILWMYNEIIPNFRRHDEEIKDLKAENKANRNDIEEIYKNRA